MRGDRPWHHHHLHAWPLFTPHARGSTEEWRRQYLRLIVYPACAGIDLHPLKVQLYCSSLPRMRGDRPVSEWRQQVHQRLPRMRGDRPPLAHTQPQALGFTPHARGSTGKRGRTRWLNPVYPACAGIDPISVRFPCSPLGLPRMRGDRPLFGDQVPALFRFTPHARGSTEVAGERHGR